MTVREWVEKNATIENKTVEVVRKNKETERFLVSNSNLIENWIESLAIIYYYGNYEIVRKGTKQNTILDENWNVVDVYETIVIEIKKFSRKKA